jgi:hypothetical protein
MVNKKCTFFTLGSCANHKKQERILSFKIWRIFCYFIYLFIYLGRSAVGREAPPQVADQPLTGEAVTLEAASNPQTKQVR